MKLFDFSLKKEVFFKKLLTNNIFYNVFRFSRHEPKLKFRKEHKKSNRDYSWAIADHMCHICGSRIMARRAMSPTSEVYKCFTCGTSGYKPQDLCWCGQRFRNSHPNSQNYICLPTKIREKYPEVKELFDSAFRSYGIDPDKLEVGFITFKEFNRIMREAEVRKAIAEGGLKTIPKYEQALKDIEIALEKELKTKLDLY